MVIVRVVKRLALRADAVIQAEPAYVFRAAKTNCPLAPRTVDQCRQEVASLASNTLLSAEGMAARAEETQLSTRVDPRKH